MASQLLIEHGESRVARRIRHNRYKVALAIAAIEGLLVLAGAIPWWLVVVLALGALGAYAGWGREHESPDVRVVTWTAAVSQLVVVLVPVLRARSWCWWPPWSLPAPRLPSLRCSSTGGRPRRTACRRGHVGNWPSLALGRGQVVRQRVLVP